MIKKSMFTFFSFFLLGLTVQAQTLSAGPMLGGTIARLAGAPSTKSLAGPAIGGFINYSVNDHVGLNLKVLYTGLGTDFKNTSDRVRLHYIQIPLTAVYYFGEIGDAFRPKVFAGAYVAPLLRATNQDGNEILRNDGTPAYQNLDFGGILGGGFNYRILSRCWLNVEGGFSRGATDVTKNALKYENVAFHLNAGVSFPIGKE